jgi:hypothetical protein
MRTLILLCIPLLVWADAGAQTFTDDYNVISIDASTLLARLPGHDITTTFPYTVTSVASGSTSQYNFAGALHGRFTSPAYMVGLNFAQVWRRDHFNFGGGLLREEGGDHGFYLKGGYGYSFFLGDLAVRPALDLYYLVDKNRMGTIDNRQKQISLLGYTAYEQFIVKEDDGVGNLYDVTYNADHLDVNYRRFSLLADPKVVLSTRPLGRFVVGLELGWMLQLYQQCDLLLEQSSVHGVTNTAGKVRLDNNGALNGPFAAINIGMRL